MDKLIERVKKEGKLISNGEYLDLMVRMYDTGTMIVKKEYREKDYKAALYSFLYLSLPKKFKYLNSEIEGLEDEIDTSKPTHELYLEPTYMDEEGRLITGHDRVTIYPFKGCLVIMWSCEDSMAHVEYDIIVPM